MFRDPLVQQAWELCRQTAECPLAIILEATAWLEERYSQAPHGHTAVVIALHYLLLAMRPELRANPEAAKTYFSRAVRWREEARRWVQEQGVLPPPHRQR